MSIWGTLAKVAGAAGAPFTGGLSLLPTVAGIGADVAGSLLKKRAAAKGRTTSGTTGFNNTSNTTNTSNYQFDPAGMAAYNRLLPQSTDVLSDYMRNPWEATYFNQQLAGTNRQLAGLADRQKANLGLNMASLGAAPDPMRQAEIVNQIGRSSSASQADNFLKLLMQAEDLRRAATTQSLNFRPLQTGSTSTTNSTSSGTGTNSSTASEPGSSMWGDILGLAGNALGALPGKGSSSGSKGSSGGSRGFIGSKPTLGGEMDRVATGGLGFDPRPRNMFFRAKKSVG